jgi:hypothetical protein
LTTTDQSGEWIGCATYTHARRHPMVLGNIGGWTPPFQLTVTQLVVLVVTYGIEMQTWRWWGELLPRRLAMVVALVLPCILAWIVRRTRVEGRSLPRLARGWLALLAAPRRGRVGGRPIRPLRPSAPLRAGIYVAPGSDGP